MARKRIKSPADVGAAVRAGKLDATGLDKAISLGPRVVPEIAAVATDLELVGRDDPGAALAVAILAAVGAPDALVPDLVAALEASPPDSEVRAELCAVLAAHPAALLARVGDTPAPAALAQALAGSDHPAVGQALEQLLDRDALAVAPAVADRGDPALLPALERHLAGITVEVGARAEDLARLHGFVMACHQLGSNAPRLVMLQLLITDRARELAAEIAQDLRLLHALDDAQE